MTAATVSAAVEKRTAGPVGLMWSRRTHFRAVLPASVDVEAFLGTAAGALYASVNPDPNRLTLMQAAESDPDSLIVALMRCAALGHMPGTDEYYLTPRKVKGKPSVLGIEGYRGIVERMYRSGAVAKVVVREVCAGDQFSYTEGLDDKPVHQFGGTGTVGTGADFFGPKGSRDRGGMVGVYAYAILTTGAVSQIVILTRDDVEAARDSGGYRADDQFSPWNRLDAGKGHPEFTGRSMWWKTAARRLEPWVPTSAEYRREQLRASASAAAQSAPSAPPEYLAGNGSGPQDIHDAEIVDEPPPGKAPKPASEAALKRMNDLIAQLDLGPPEDIAALIRWITGGPGDQLTGAEVSNVTSLLRDALETAGGDTDKAAAEIWAQYKRMNPQAGDDGA